MQKKFVTQVIAWPRHSLFKLVIVIMKVIIIVINTIVIIVINIIVIPPFSSSSLINHLQPLNISPSCPICAHMGRSMSSLNTFKYLATPTWTVQQQQ